MPSRPRDLRIERHPILSFDRGRKVSIRFEGKPIEAYENESIGAALYANGIKIFSRSFKYRRPRGLLCMWGRCPNCLMRVGGIPNVPVCLEPVRDGVAVERQRGWPSPDFDVLGILDRLDFLFPIGFQYKRFIHPRLLWPLYAWALRNLAGLGEITEVEMLKGSAGSKVESVGTDVAVVGGGPAGLMAAISAADAGANVMLIDENPQLGGRLAIETREYPDLEPFPAMRGFRIAEALSKRARDKTNIRFLVGCIAFGYYEDGTLAVASNEKFVKVFPKRLIVATGAYEEILLFENNDLPGILLSTGVQMLMHRYGIRPGNEALVVSIDERGLHIASQLLDAGVKVKAVAYLRPPLEDGSMLVKRLREAGTEIYSPYTIERAIGRNVVKGARIARADAESKPIAGTRKVISCDLICTAGGFRPANELVLQAGCDMRYDEARGGFIPTHDRYMEARPGIHVAGEAAGTNKTLLQILLEGEVAGTAAALSLGFREQEAESRLEKSAKRLASVKLL